MMFIRRCVAFLVFVVVSTTAYAGARDELRRFTTDLRGLDGQFRQQVFDDNGRLKETSSGRVTLSVPRLFRWEYIRPHPQLIVADGQKVWIYDPDLQQVTVRPQAEEERNSPLNALTDPARLERDFDVSEEAAPRNGLQWLTITPKIDSQASFQVTMLGFGASGLSRMEVVDVIGQRTIIEFTDWKRNPKLAADIFKFTPGLGVDVVGE